MKLSFILVLLVSLPVSAVTPDTEQLFKSSNEPARCYFDKCFTQDEVIEAAGTLSYESQEGLLELFQARENIKVKRGQLLPSFNLKIASPIEIFEFIPNLLGFMFPSNWFAFQESKLHAKAQEHSFITLVANQKNTAQGLYLAIHQELLSALALQRHIEFTTDLKLMMMTRYELGDVAFEDIEELNAFLSQLKADYALQKNLIQQSASELSYLMADVNLEQLAGPAIIQLPALTSLPPIDIKTYSASVLERSPELKTLTYLSAAASFSKRTRTYEFLNPESGPENAFGFGYRANLRIETAQMEKIKLQQKAFAAGLKKNLFQLGQNLNTALEIHQHALSIENSLKYILQSLLSDFEASSKLDINRYISVLRESVSTQQMKLNAIHSYLQAQANLERLLLEGAYYQSIEPMLPKNNSKLACYQRKENKLIKAAVEKGELKLPEELEFKKDEDSFCI